jgi:dextranase
MTRLVQHMRSMRVHFFLFFLLIILGGPVYAVDLALQITPDKSFYESGQPVRLLVSASSPEIAQVRARVFYLSEQVAELEATLIDGATELVWTPPATAPRGYGVDIALVAADGQLMAATSTAFDVLDHWTQAPRYGFLTEYTERRADPETTMQWVTRYHINGLQFYDWQYRHEQLLPPPGTDQYADLLGREMSLSTVKALIDAAHRHNIAAMPYTAIYGASADFYREHPDWALFRAPDKPYEFGDNYLIIMNPEEGSPWSAHLLDQFAEVLDQTAFDGIHIDQYGAPMRGRNAAGELVRLDEAFPAFVNEAASLVDSKRGTSGAVIFNLVRNWPLETVAPSDQDAVYIEVWEPYRSLLDLYRIVSQAQKLSGGKPVIIAAYVSPQYEVNVRLTNALIFAAGGYRIELGEPQALLADPYFPKFGLMDEHLQEVMRRYYDFIVRYENILSLDTHDATAERSSALTIGNISTAGSRSRDRVAVLVRAGQRTEVFNLINLMGIDGENWAVPIQQSPTPYQNLQIAMEVDRPVKQIYAASPDHTEAQLVPLNYTVVGNTVNLTVPSLEYWTMILVEYES